MFELPGLDDVEEVVVGEESVNNAAPPLLVHSDPKLKKEAATAG
jgi:ATP-dependent Clp protease ATP-binding subunit ClpX